MHWTHKYCIDCILGGYFFFLIYLFIYLLKNNNNHFYLFIIFFSSVRTVQFAYLPYAYFRHSGICMFWRLSLDYWYLLTLIQGGFAKSMFQLGEFPFEISQLSITSASFPWHIVNFLFALLLHQESLSDLFMLLMKFVEQTRKTTPWLAGMFTVILIY